MLLYKMLHAINNLHDRSTDSVIDYITKVVAPYYDMTVAKYKRLAIVLIVYDDIEVQLNVYRSNDYNGTWYINGINEYYTLEDYIKHYKRVKNREYEDKHYLLCGCSKRYKAFIDDRLSSLRLGRLDALSRLTSSYDADIKRYERMANKIALMRRKEKNYERF